MTKLDEVIQDEDGQSGVVLNVVVLISDCRSK